VGLTEKKTHVVRPSAGKSEAAGQATFGMANLRRKTTGLPFIVFISQRDEGRHAARVKVSPEPRVRPDEMGSYSVSSFEWKDGPRLSTPEERLLGRWIDMNAGVLLDYRNGEIEYTEDAIDQLKPI
jgi:hypothetical protein